MGYGLTAKAINFQKKKTVNGRAHIAAEIADAEPACGPRNRSGEEQI